MNTEQVIEEAARVRAYLGAQDNRSASSYELRDFLRGNEILLRHVRSWLILNEIAVDNEGDGLVLVGGDHGTGQVRPSFREIVSGELPDLAGQTMSALSSLTLFPNLKTAAVVSETQTGSMKLRGPSGDTFRVPVHDETVENVQIWDLESSRPMSALHLKVCSTEVYSNGERAFVIGDERKLEVWDIVAQKVVAKTALWRNGGVALAPRAGLVGGAFGKEKWSVWDLKGREPEKISSIDFGDPKPNKVKFSDEGDKVFSCHWTSRKRPGNSEKRWSSEDKTTTVKIWDSRTGELERSVVLGADWAHTFEIDPDQGLAMTSGGDGTVQIWSLRGASASLLKTIDTGDEIRHLVVDRDHWKVLITTGVKTPGVHLWSLESGDRLETFVFPKPMLASPLVRERLCFAVLGWDKSFSVLRVEGMV